MNKYRNKITEVDGIKFHSKAEAKRWQELNLLQKAGHIKELTRQNSYILTVNHVRIAVYKADFVYFDVKMEKWVVEDKKGIKTRDYVIKKKLMRAIYQIDIFET